MSVGYWSPCQCCDLTFVAAQHCQVTGGFMWGHITLCGWYDSFGMLRQMHIYFKFCVSTVGIDDMFSLRNFVNKYMYIDLFIYFGNPNTRTDTPPVY
jgi:hypothetical protein